MLNKAKKNSTRLAAPNGQPIIPDPWESVEQEPHFPSPLELDRLLKEPHPLMPAAEPYLEISPAGQPGVGLLTDHISLVETRPVEMLLQSELKLPIQWGDRLNLQLEKALALLYWLGSDPEYALT